MKVVYPICCGIDVHKTFLVATLITSQGIIPHYSQKRFSTLSAPFFTLGYVIFHAITSFLCYWVLYSSLLSDSSLYIIQVLNCSCA
jgi:hypothetical protein